MSSLKAFAGIAVIEAVSWLALIVAMFFKYVVDTSWGDDAVSQIGRIHGFFVIIYIALLFMNHVQRKWSIQKSAIDLLALVIPGMGFWVARNVLAEERTGGPATGAA